jgi:glutamyl-tRNA reductase
MAVQAVVIGTGWAGEGHIRGLQAAGVEVVALCGRTPEPAREDDLSRLMSQGRDQAIRIGQVTQGLP